MLFSVIVCSYTFRYVSRRRVDVSFRAFFVVFFCVIIYSVVLSLLSVVNCLVLFVYVFIVVSVFVWLIYLCCVCVMLKFVLYCMLLF